MGLICGPAQEPGADARNRAPMDPRELIKGVREALSVRQVFGEPVERDGVTVIPAATVIGGGGGGGGEGAGSRRTATARPSRRGRAASASASAA